MLRFIPSLISLVNNIFDVMMRLTGSKEGKRELKGSIPREKERDMETEETKVMSCCSQSSYPSARHRE